MSAVTHAEIDAKFDRLFDRIDEEFKDVKGHLSAVDERLRNMETAFSYSEGFRKAQAALWGIASGLFSSIVSGVVIWLLTKD